MNNRKLLDLSLAEAAAKSPDAGYLPDHMRIAAIQEDFCHEVAKLTDQYLQAGEKLLADEAEHIGPEKLAVFKAKFMETATGLVSMGAVGIAAAFTARYNEPAQLADCIRQLQQAVPDMLAYWRSYNEDTVAAQTSAQSTAAH